MARKFISYVVFICAAIVLIMVAGALAQEPQQPAQVSLEPSSGTFLTGTIFTVAIRLDSGGATLDGVDIRYLRYDPQLLEVQDMNTALPGVQIAPGTLFPYTPVNVVDPARGLIDIVQVANAGTPFSGTGTLATIHFKVKAVGTATLSFDVLPGRTSDTNALSRGFDILGKAHGAVLTLAGDLPPLPMVNDREYQPTVPAVDRPASTGAVRANLTQNFFDSAPLSSAMVTLNPGSVRRVTDREGVVLFSDLANGSYSLTFEYQGYRPYTSSFTISRGQTLNAHYYLRRICDGGFFPGDLLTVAGDSAVYYIGGDCRRYVFPSEAVFKTWFPDFYGVAVVTPERIARLPVVGRVSVRPGTMLVKSAGSSTVYAVEPGSHVRPIVSEDVARMIYGAAWASRVIELPDILWRSYTVEDVALSPGSYPAGLLFTYEGSPERYALMKNSLSGMTVRRRFVSMNAFKANFLQDRFMVQLPVSASFPDGVPIERAEANFVDATK